MKPYGYVYLTINTLTGARYVGQHRGAFRSKYKGSGVIIKHALAKYGTDAFTVSLLQSARDQRELDELELLYIRELKELYPASMIYNIREGGTGLSGSPIGAANHRFGKPHSEETKKKIGIKNRQYRGANHGNFGKVRSEATRQKISQGKKGQVSRIGWKMSADQKAKISAARKAKFSAGFKMQYSSETRRKISEGRKRYWASIKEVT